MGSNEGGINLLKSLKRLYFRIMVLRAEDSARSVRNLSNTAAAENIVSPLSECISKLAANAANNPVDASSSQMPEVECHSHGHASLSREAYSKDELGELSLHLKDSHRYSGVSHATGERLMQSTWEHFHNSIRLARQGDVEAAKIHAELTNNALKEATHYLSETVYFHFSNDVMKALEDINAQIE